MASFIRWENQNVPNLPQQSEIFLLTEKLARLEKRVTELETRLRALDSDVLGTSEQKYGIFADFDSEPVESEQPPKRRGRPPSVAPEELARRRDYLVQFIEVRWPDLVEGMNQSATLEGLAATIKRACPGGESSEGYIQMTEHIGSLWEFLKSRRYQGEPRQIAYALAGVPEMAWSWSFEYCTKNPSRQPINPPAFLDHIRRRNPNCHVSILANGVTAENTKLLRACCAQCRRLASKPEWIVRALEEGKPLIVGQRS